jgi:hypothetical protein
MKAVKYVGILSVLALLFSLNALARDKNQHSVSIPDSVQVGTTQLQAGTYRVKWEGTAPQVQVTFIREGKTVATVPATLKNDNAITQDDIVVDPASGSARALKEIDFGHQQQALVFGEAGM